MKNNSSCRMKSRVARNSSGGVDERDDDQQVENETHGLTANNIIQMEQQELQSPRSLDDFLTECAYNGRNTSPIPSTPLSYWIIYLSLGIANSSDASEILCLSYILSEENFELSILQNEKWRGGLLAATVFAGMLIGGLLVGCLGDWFGRKPMLLTGLSINCIAGLLSATAIDVYTLSIFRFIAGIGIGATVPPLFALCSELSPPSNRGFWVTVVASFWMVGSVYVALVGYVTLGMQYTSWRVFAAICAIPSLLGCILVNIYVPESPRFLLLEGQHDEALAVIQILANAMHYQGPTWTVEELEYYYPTDNNRTSSNNGEENDVVLLNRNGGNWLLRILCGRQLFSFLRTAINDFLYSTSKLYTQHLRSTTLPLQMVWFSLSFGSYGLYTWINTLFFEVHLENVYYNALLFAASNIPGNILSALLMDKTGRASMLTGSVLAAAMSLISFAYVAYQRENGSTLSSHWIVISACSFQCFTISAWNAIDVLSSELFPTKVRSTGMGVCAATGRVGAMIAQFINAPLAATPVALLSVAACALLLGAITPIFLPKDQTGQPVQDYTTPQVSENDRGLAFSNTPRPESHVEEEDDDDRIGPIRTVRRQTSSIPDDCSTTSSMSSGERRRLQSKYPYMKVHL